MFLPDIPEGETVSVLGVHGRGELRQRLLDMGLTKGTRATVKRASRWGSPIVLALRGYELIAGLREASLVEVAAGG